MGIVTPIRTPLNVDAAWREYVELMGRFNTDPASRVDPEHCAKVARAWKRWQFLYLATEGQ